MKNVNKFYILRNKCINLYVNSNNEHGKKFNKLILIIIRLKLWAYSF